MSEEPRAKRKALIFLSGEGALNLETVADLLEDLADWLRARG